MKKSLIAIAVAAALPAFAQAQTNVQLYGIVDTSIGVADVGGPNSNTEMVVLSGVQSTSRFGFRGTESLGGGLSAIFNYEAGVGSDTGGGPDSAGLFQRRSIVGLKGGFGEVRLGRDYTPGFSAAGQTDIMGYSFYGNWLNFTAGSTQGTTFAGVGGIATRFSNGIYYSSPSFGNTACMAAPQSTECGAFSGGLAVNLAYAAGENLTGNSSAGDAYGGSVVYKGGPLVVQGYYQTGTARPGSVAQDVDVDQYGFGAGWNFGMFRIAGNWGETKATPTGGGDIKNRAYGLGGAMKLGGGEILINFIDREIKGLAGEKPSATTWGLAYTYPLSKRTNVYASYGMTDNNSAGAFSLNYSQGSLQANNNATGSGALGADLRAFALGVRHLF